MNWRLLLTLVALATFWALVSYVARYHETMPAIFGPATAPVPPNDLWSLNPV